MLKRLIAAGKIWKADRIAQSIVRPIRVCLLRVTDETGQLNPLVSEDNFVLSYIYGMTACYMEALGKKEDTWICAYAVQQTFEHLFGRGRELAERCLELANRNDEDHKYAVQLGYSETRKAIDAKGVSLLSGLMEHLKLYNN
jgi:hypothetical protein